MKTREELINFIDNQFAESGAIKSNMFKYIPPGEEANKRAVHYGRLELSDLIDFIYGENDETK